MYKLILYINGVILMYKTDDIIIKYGQYIIEQQSTVRKTADHFGASKSSVHKDLVDRLPKINRILAREVGELLQSNKAVRHIRGGEATRDMYRLKAEMKISD